MELLFQRCSSLLKVLFNVWAGEAGDVEAGGRLQVAGIGKGIKVRWLEGK